jgi:hypothetical protein
MASPVSAQNPKLDRILPDVHYFPALVADPLEVRLGVGLLKTNLFRADGAPEGRERPRGFFIPDPEDAASDVVASTAVGGTVPWFQLARWSDSTGISLGVLAGVVGRFRIEYPTREDVGQDWFVGGPLEIAADRWAARIRFMHRSSHLGDEVVETTGASRIEVGGEFIDGMFAYRIRPDTRVYGGTSWIFRSYTENTTVLRNLNRRDRTTIQLGAEHGWYPWINRSLGMIGAIDWRRAERTGWEDSFAAAAGLALRTPARNGKLIVRYFSGASLLEQFFLTNEKYWALELNFDF